MKCVAMGNKGSFARVLLCTVAPFAMFQTASIATAQDAIEDDTDLTVVVTASRTEESISSIPGTVQVISGEELQQAVAANGDITTALGRYVPGLNLSNDTLSGLGETFRGRSLQVLVNGSPRTSSLRKVNRVLSLIDADSIERIEIINGASAVYGDGGTGGIINVITKSADKEGFSGSFSTTISASERNVKDSAHVLTSVEAGYRKDGKSIQLNGQFKNTGDLFAGNGTRVPEDPATGQGGGSGIEQYNISGRVGFEAERFDVSIYANLLKMEQDIEFYSDFTSDPVSQNTSDLYKGLSPMEDAKNLTATLNVYDLGLFGDANVELFYNDTERRSALVPLSDANPFTYSPDPDRSQNSVFMKQVGVRTTFDRDLSNLYEGLEFSYGGDFTYEDVTQKLPDGRDIMGPMEQNSFAVFGQLKVPLGEMFELRGGLRYQRYDLSVGDYTRPSGQIKYPGFPILDVPEASVKGGDAVYDATVFNLGGVMHVSDELDLFAGFSQGYSVPDIGGFTRRAVDYEFKAPLADIRDPLVTLDPALGINRLDPNTWVEWETEFNFSDLQPEAAIVNNYEIGGRFDNGKYSVATSVFLSTTDKGLTFNPAASALTQRKERIWGAELNARAVIDANWSLGTILAYKEGVYDYDEDGDLDDALPNNRIGSRFQATLYTDYRFENGLSLHGEAIYGSGRDVDDGNPQSEDLKLKQTFTVNAGAKYAADFGTVKFGVENVFDTKQTNVTASSGRNRNVLAEGRRVFLQYTKTF
ncbi:TonB-dependent receptor [Pseudovibrio sp. Ad37]|uniref:TonB-dependent receptor n=1 Tax=Pseudovibrio sp. Ad37 TaxID=989422 RepID=UPI0007B2821E|nr:TonB-dependent receptor [Pseudovibrio sp. Ad37]KZL27949.1 Ferric aerobactin receptor precursor [Pseudovibrio sp. Ad37]